MVETAEGKDRWLEAQLKEANNLVALGGQALRQGQTNAGAQALVEAEAILEMAEEETGELLKIQARVFNELGVVHQRQNRLDRSLEYHEKAAEICDQLVDRGEDFAANSAATHLNLSSIYLAMGKVEKAGECGEKSLELISTLLGEGDEKKADPLELGALQNLAVIHARQEKWEEANERMERAAEAVKELVEMGQKNFQAQFAQGCQQLSVILFEKERFDEALNWGRQAEAFSEKAYEDLGQGVLPVYLISQLNLISYYERLGQYADAEDCLWKALDVAGNDPRILHRGVVFYENCRKQADARLEEGNLPREEVDAGLDELMERVEVLGGMEKLEQAAQRLRGQA